MEPECVKTPYRALQEVLGAYHKFTLTSISNFWYKEHEW